MTLDWHDPNYAAKPTNPNRELLLRPEVRHYEGIELELDRAEWTRTVEDGPKMTMAWDFGNEDREQWITPHLFSSLGLGVIHPYNRVVYSNVSA